MKFKVGDILKYDPSLEENTDVRWKVCSVVENTYNLKMTQSFDSTRLDTIEVNYSSDKEHVEAVLVLCEETMALQAFDKTIDKILGEE